MSGRTVARHHVRQSFDLGACRDVDLVPNILDAAVTAGWPATQSLFAWAAVNKEIGALAKERISSCIAKIYQEQHVWYLAYLGRLGKASALLFDPTAGDAPTEQEQEELRSILRHAHEEAEAASTTLFMALAVVLSPDTSRALLDFLKSNIHDALNCVVAKKFEFRFHFDHCVLAHGSKNLCTICSGLNKVCVCNTFPNRASSSQRCPNGFYFGLHQGMVLEHSKKACHDTNTVTKRAGWNCNEDPLDYIRNLNPHGSIHAKNVHTAGMLARAMFHQADVYSAHKQTCTLKGRELHDDSDTGVSALSLLLRNSRFVAPCNTLQGRLRLDATGMQRAEDEVSRVAIMEAREKAAVQSVRHEKLLVDCDVYIKRHLGDGESLAILCKTFPLLQPSLKKILADANDQPVSQIDRTADATAMIPVRKLLDRVVEILHKLAPHDHRFMGKAKGHSSEAYQFVHGILGNHLVGFSEGPFDEAVGHYGWSPVSYRESPVLNDLSIGTLSIFDGLQRGSWHLHFEPPSSPNDHYAIVCKLVNCKLGISMCKKFEPWKVADRNRWKTIFTDTFEQLRDSGHVDLDLPPDLKPQVWKLVGVGNRNAMEEVCSYLQVLVGSCIMFPQTRHLGLFYTGWTARRIAGHLGGFHDDWANTAIRADPCPDNITYFVHWLLGNPTKRTLEWRAPKILKRVKVSVAAPPTSTAQADNSSSEEEYKHWNPFYL